MLQATINLTCLTTETSYKMFPFLFPSHSDRQCTLLSIALVVVGLVFILDHEEQQNKLERFLALVMHLKRQRDGEVDNEDEDGRVKKRSRILWDHESARAAVHTHYLGPYPVFADRQFERVFRITRTVADRILQVAATSDRFFTEQYDATKKRMICPKVKLLMGLQLLASGVSPASYQHYYQMGESTGLMCMKKLARILSTADELTSIFLRSMSRADAKSVSQIHLERHGVAGMIGSLDCMHIGWKNCPVAWQGQYCGSKGKPTLVLEAFADYNLWIWHASFGSAGTLNDINIWDRSPLLQAFLDGSFTKNVDFNFTIGGRVFRHLWLLTDGIYPELARFVKTIDEPGNPAAGVYAAWQEASRKDIERAFGVLQRKFAILAKNIELWHVKEISPIVMSCILLHNMMVQVRMERCEEEAADWYEGVGQVQEDVEQDPQDPDPDQECVVIHNAEILTHTQTVHDNLHLMQILAKNQSMTLQQQCAQQRWGKLYNLLEHNNLRQAIMDELQNKNATEE
jgi:hypothetical protein